MNILDSQYQEWVIKPTQNEFDPLITGIQLFMFRKALDASCVDIVQPLEIHTKITSDAHAYPIQPMVTISTATARGLMDALWNMGIRPSQAVDSREVTGALEKHLRSKDTHINDLRVLLNYFRANSPPPGLIIPRETPDLGTMDK